MDPNDGVLNAISPQKSADLNSDGFGLAISPDRSNNISPAFESGEPFMMRPSLRPCSLSAPLADPFASPAQEKKVAFNILGSDEEEDLISGRVAPPDIDLADLNADPLFNPVDGRIVAKESKSKQKKSNFNVFRGIDDHMFGDDEPSGFGISDAESEEEEVYDSGNIGIQEVIGGARIIQDYANNADPNPLPPPESPKRQGSFQADDAGTWFENPPEQEKVIDDYVVPEARSENLHPFLTSSYPKPKNKLAVKDLSLYWTFYGGNDWHEDSGKLLTTTSCQKRGAKICTLF